MVRFGIHWVSVEGQIIDVVRSKSIVTKFSACNYKVNIYLIIPG